MYHSREVHYNKRTRMSDEGVESLFKLCKK
jgi:hypothetical protein